MNGVIYLNQDNEQLVEMTEQKYDSEDLLQALIAKYPNLLAGNQMDSEMPRRWLLISREAELPSDEDSEGRWSVDHLFLDQDAIPTIVEVKRSTDTRIRREVIGQMLEYAANAVVYWPIESIRAKFDAQFKDRGKDSQETLSQFLGDNSDFEQFWQKAKTNLQAGRVRMVFVADEIPSELQRIVEFLNGQMDPAEVLAVEIKQYVGRGLQTLVPRVLGQTAEAQQKKSIGTREKRQWDEISFFKYLKEKHSTEEVMVARKIFEWAENKQLRSWWGEGKRDGSFFPVLDHNGTEYTLIALWTYGSVEIQFQHMKAKPFSDKSKRLEFLRRINEIQGVSIPEIAITRRPNISLSNLTEEIALKQFIETLDWAINEIKTS